MMFFHFLKIGVSNLAEITLVEALLIAIREKETGHLWMRRIWFLIR